MPLRDLDELLALFPDNNTGAIDAADIRTAFTVVYEFAVLTDARLTALELTTGGNTISLSGLYVPSGTPNSNPGNNRMTTDTGILDTATWLRFYPTDKNSVDLTNAIANCATIYAQSKTNAERWVLYAVTGYTTANGFPEVSVTVTDSGGTSGSSVNQDTVFIFGGIPA